MRCGGSFGETATTSGRDGESRKLVSHVRIDCLIGKSSWLAIAGLVLISAVQGCAPERANAPADPPDRPERTAAVAPAAPADAPSSDDANPSGSAFLQQEPVREELAELRRLAAPERLQGALPDTVLGLYSEARGVGARLADRYSRAADAHEVSARIELATGHTETAKARWQRALEIEPEYPYAHHGLGMVYGKLGDYERALRHHLRAVAQSPQFAEAVHRAADLYVTLGRPEEAIELLRQHLAGQPRDLEARYRIAQAYLQQGQYQAAQTAYEKILDQDETIPRAHYGLSVAFARTGDREKAEAALDRHRRLIAAEEEADFQHRQEEDHDYREQARRMAAYYLDAARVYLANRDPEQAVLVGERSMQLDSSSAAARTLLASIYQQLGRQADAVRLYRQATAAQPEVVEHWLQLGWLLAQTGDLSDAEQALHEAARRDPDSDLAHAALAQLYLQFMNRPQDAATSAQRAVELRPQPGHWGLLSQALAAQGRLGEAEQAASQAATADPGNPVWRELIAAIRQASTSANP